MRVPQSKAELIAHLREQISFLRSSAAAFDGGLHSEGKRLAVVLRILLHDTKNSTSLLEQLGIKSSLQYYDGYAEGLGPGAVVHMGVGMAFTAKGIRYRANLSEPRRTSDFAKYWSGIAVKQGPVEHRRSDIILAVSNMDGGAHVDPTLNARYAKLSRDYTSVWTVRIKNEIGTVENGPELPIVRQCAFEVELTLARQAPALLGVEHL